MISAKEYMKNATEARSNLKKTLYEQINQKLLEASQQGFLNVPISYYDYEDHNEEFNYDEPFYVRNRELMEEIAEELKEDYDITFKETDISNELCIKDNCSGHICNPLYYHDALAIFEVIVNEEEVSEEKNEEVSEEVSENQ